MGSIIEKINQADERYKIKFESVDKATQKGINEFSKILALYGIVPMMEFTTIMKYIAKDDDLLIRKYNIPEASAHKLMDCVTATGKDKMLYGMLSKMTQISRNLLPYTVARLLVGLLAPKKDEVLLNVPCGAGHTLNFVAMYESSAKLVGMDQRAGAIEFAESMTSLLDMDIKFQNGDFLEELKKEECSAAFDKIMMIPPWRRSSINTLEVIRTLCDADGIGRVTSPEFAYIVATLKALKADGKAVVLVPAGVLFNHRESRIRQWLCKKGFIQAVISLPEKLFSPNTSIPVNAIILSKGNSSVKMVEASNIFQAERRRNILSMENVESILKALESETTISKTVDLANLKETDFDLQPSRYMECEPLFENAVSFGELIKSIKRGNQMPAKDLDDLVTDEETKYHYLQLANIQDGIVASHLPNLTAIDESQDKYCVDDGDMIMSKINSPCKFTIVNHEPDEKIMALGNVYIVKLDTEKVNPYYIKAFLESHTGTALLNLIASGGVIKSIPLARLREMKVPVPSREVQDRIADKYKKSLHKILEYKAMIAKEEQYLSDIIESE